MARPRKITTEIMLGIVEEYFCSVADGNTAMLKYTLIANYANSLGHSAAAYDFRRNEIVRSKIEELKSTNGMFGQSAPLVYKNLNVEEFIRTNKDNQQLKVALIELDAYWKSIFEYANSATNKNKKTRENEGLRDSKIAELIAENKILSIKSKELSSEKRKLMLENRYLRSMIKTNLYPALANEILKSSQILTDKDSPVPKKTVDNIVDSNHPKSFGEAIKQDQKIISKEEKILKMMWEECDA